MKKNPGIAALLSFIIPGSGYIYCEQILNGIISFAVVAVFVVGGTLNYPAEGWWSGLLIGAAIWIFVIYETHKAALKFNKRIHESSQSL